jgi:phosphoribosylamine--glycine ligase
VVEFNCRLGDPETQVVLPRVSGLTEALWASARGQPIPPLTAAPVAAVTTVVAAAGYPDHPLKGMPVTLPDPVPDGAVIFHAGTTRDEAGVVRSAGGRVLSVTGLAPTFTEAQRISRETAERIDLPGKQFRRDIGWREAARLR